MFKRTDRMNVTFIENLSFNNNKTEDMEQDVLFINTIVFLEATTGVLVTVGNVFILALIQRKKLLGRSTNVFVFSIAVADCLNGFVSIPAHIFSLLYTDTASIYFCKCYRFSAYLSKTVVPYTVLFMTAEKVMRILCPTREIVTVARCMFFTSLLWFFASAFNIWCVVLFTSESMAMPIGSLLVKENQDSPENHYVTVSNKCVLNQRFLYLHKTFLTLDVAILFVIPVMSVLCLYSILLYKYFTVLRERILTYFYVIKLLFALFINVFLTQLPLEVFTVMDNTHLSTSSLWLFLSNLATSIYFTRGIWNLLIYGYFKHYVCRKRSMTSIRAGNNNGPAGTGLYGNKNRFQQKRVML